MRSTFVAFLCCLGLMAAGCNDKPKPGGPMPKAAQAVVVPSAA
ncbi:hypothetical protein M2165_002833 [Variovorax sp. TBS-050B]|nr:hypothetical protein [Variovorax sp. TBS-050B]MDH6592944.1 hypothetical protein [Variovorax sp. TBS-050B]